MRPLRWLFAPDFAAPLTGALGDTRRAARGLASLPAFAWAPERKGAVRVGGWAAAAGTALAVGGIGSIAVGIAGLASAHLAEAQTIDAGLFGETDEPTRSLLRFLNDFDARTYAALGDMLFVFNGGLLVLAGFLLVWHTVAGTVDTAREGRWGFGGWEIVRIVTAVALMAPLPGGMNGAQHMVVGLAHLGGDFAAAVWEPFSEEVAGKCGAGEAGSAGGRAGDRPVASGGSVPPCGERGCAGRGGYAMAAGDTAGVEVGRREDLSFPEPGQRWRRRTCAVRSASGT